MTTHTRQEVIDQAIACARAYGHYHPDEPVLNTIDMSTTGDIPEGYSDLIFVHIGEMGYIVSCKQGVYRVEMADRMPETA